MVPDIVVVIPGDTMVQVFSYPHLDQISLSAVGANATRETYYYRDLFGAWYAANGENVPHDWVNSIESAFNKYYKPEYSNEAIAV